VVVLDAPTEWCIRKHDDPDVYLISLAITLYNDGNNTPERLLNALEIEFVGDDIPLSPSWNLCAASRLIQGSGFNSTLSAGRPGAVFSIQTAPGLPLDAEFALPKFHHSTAVKDRLGWSPELPTKC
jgi:hypothetical protein